MTGDTREKAMEVLVSRGMLQFAGSMNAMGFSIDRVGMEYVRSWFEFYYNWPGRRVVGFTEPEDIATKLLADSFSFQAVPGIAEVDNTMDVGSGNGWPGLAVRLCVPLSKLTLIDSRLGACQFLSGLLRASPLSGTSVQQSRAEDMARDKDFAESFGLVVSRAMAEPAVALELCAPLARIGGRVILWCGPGDASLQMPPALPELGLSLLGLFKYSLPSGLGRRVLGVYDKTSGLKPGFPRRYSVIIKKPLF